MLLPCALLAALPHLPPPPPDEGYDLLVLDMPHRVVMKDSLQFFVRGRPGNPYVVYGDIGNNLTRYKSLFIHLNMGPALFVAAAGIMPAHGSSPHALPIPDMPWLDNTPLYFQGFAADAGVLGGVAASDGKAVTFHQDLGQPLMPLLTVNQIPRDQNGSEPSEGTITVPPTDFTIDMTFDPRGRSPIDPLTLVITADQALGNGTIAAGSNLAVYFQVGANNATATVSSGWDFPANTTVTLTATVKNQSGIVSPAETFKLLCEPFSASGRPFLVQQLWHVDFDAHDLDNSGVADFREDLVLFGLGNDPTATAGPSYDVDQWVRSEVHKLLRAAYGYGTLDAVNVDFVLQAPGTTHARICVGGRNTIPKSQLPPGAQETTGAAWFNPNNRSKTTVDCYGQVGVHPRSVYWLFKDVPAFKLVFDALILNPVGNDPDDLVVTAPGFDPTSATIRQRVRWLEIKTGVDAFSRAVRFILVQETSHSMGLVPSGVLGAGGLLGSYLHGHSTFGHFDDGLGSYLSGNNSTPAPAQAANLLMVWDHFQSGRGHFTPLEWAYLRERVVYK